MFKKRLLAALLSGFSFGAAPVQAVSFEATFRKLISDGALDRLEYVALQELALEISDPEDHHLAHEILVMLSHYQDLIQLKFGYEYRNRTYQAKFLFSPLFAEQEPLQASSTKELLGKISQQDLLPETQGDGFRCGAAALLAGHYLIYGSFGKAFRQLNTASGPLTYRQIHLAQESLYQSANKDGQHGLTQRLLYQVDAQGKVKIIEHDGEIEQAARRIGLHVVPLKITERSDLLDRQRVIVQLWQTQPKVPLMVGVYLDEKTGHIWPPNETDRVQNHFVLVFRQSPKIWLYNSGVSNNGRQDAIFELNAEAMRRYVTQTEGSVNFLVKYP